jgi:hypothetical protein
MKVLLPYNTMVLGTGDLFVEGLKAGDSVRGYHYNEKKIVDFTLTAVTKVDPVHLVTLHYSMTKPITFCALTKVLTQGGPIECYKAPFLMGVCHANPRQLNMFTKLRVEESRDTVPVYELEWEGQDYFLWAEGILVGSPS